MGPYRRGRERHHTTPAPARASPADNAIALRIASGPPLSTSP